MRRMKRERLQPQPIPKRLYTVEEAAFYLGRTAWSVRELIWAGDIPVVKVGRRIHLDIQDLQSFVESHKVREGA